MTVAEIALADAAKARVTKWRVVEGELLLRSPDFPDDRALRCDRCDRRHWIVETRDATLVVTCHGCGARRDLVLAEVLPPSA